jgi:hypothetical protein
MKGRFVRRKEQAIVEGNETHTNRLSYCVTFVHATEPIPWVLWNVSQGKGGISTCSENTQLKKTAKESSFKKGFFRDNTEWFTLCIQYFNLL